MTIHLNYADGYVTHHYHTHHDVDYPDGWLGALGTGGLRGSGAQACKVTGLRHSAGIRDQCRRVVGIGDSAVIRNSEDQGAREQRLIEIKVLEVTRAQGLSVTW